MVTVVVRTTQLKIIVSNREDVEAGLLVRSSYALISIRDPDKRPVRFKKPSALLAAIELTFHDAEPASNLATPSHIALMTTEDGQRIAQFLSRWRSRAGALVVHCEQGMSRSPGVALAIAEYLGQDTKWIRQAYQPNEYVRGLVADALHQTTTSDHNG